MVVWVSDTPSVTGYHTNGKAVWRVSWYLCAVDEPAEVLQRVCVAYTSFSVNGRVSRYLAKGAMKQKGKFRMDTNKVTIILCGG